MSQKTKMQQTNDLGSDWWNDSNDHLELKHAYDEGAVGATSNPVITLQSVKNHPDLWNPEIDKMIIEHPNSSEDEIQKFKYDIPLIKNRLESYEIAFTKFESE